MKSSAVIAPALALLMTSGCSSIDQSALVYVSTVKVGIGASSGTAETPGAKVSIGVEANDAAYVPVLVTRRCKVATSADCTSAKYELKPISGNNSISETARAEIARLRAGAVGAAVRTVKTRQDAVRLAMDAERAAELDDQKFKSDTEFVGEFDSRVRAAAAAAATAPTEPAEITAARERLAAKPNTAANLTAARQARERAATELATANAALDEAEIKLSGLLSEDPRSEGVKSDAYSVYGSFNSVSNASAGNTGPTAGLTMGKTFSTGVAAQIVSEGVRGSAVSSAVGACIAKTKELADTLSDQAAKEAVFLAGIRACGGIPK